MWYYVALCLLLSFLQWIMAVLAIRFGIREYFQQKRLHLLEMLQYGAEEFQKGDVTKCQTGE